MSVRLLQAASLILACLCETEPLNLCGLEVEDGSPGTLLVQLGASLRFSEPRETFQSFFEPVNVSRAEIARTIAKTIGSNKTTIPRETSRNSSEDGNTSTAVEENTLFAHATYHKVNDTADGVTVDLQIAQANDILSIFLFMLVPLSLAWVYYFYSVRLSSSREQSYLLLLQISIAALNLGGNLVNQSLSVLTKAPFTLTAMQSLSMFFFSIYAVLLHFWAAPRVELRVIRNEIFTWLPAAAAFGVFQIADHLEATYCSLSERTAFGNLAPVVGIMIEVSMRPCLIRRASEKEIGLSSKMALALKVLGASVFATQYPDFNFLGMQVSALYVSTMVAYRLTQRFLLDRIPTCPVASLTMIDALVSLTISGFMSRMEIEDFGASMKLWWNDSSICTMLLLSFCTFSVGHWAMLHLIRCDTATSTMVIQNISSGFAVINGILYFNDKEFERPFAFAGILLVISGGMWWTILQSLAVKETKPLDAEKDSS